MRSSLLRIYINIPPPICQYKFLNLIIQRVEKLNYKFLHADKLRESEINFVFCEWELVLYPLATKQYTVLFLPNSHVNLEPRVSCALHNSLPRAKDGKRKRRQGLDVLAVFPILLSATSCTDRPAPFIQGRQIGLFILFGAVQPLYQYLI